MNIVSKIVSKSAKSEKLLKGDLFSSISGMIKDIDLDINLDNIYVLINTAYNTYKIIGIDKEITKMSDLKMKAAFLVISCDKNDKTEVSVSNDKFRTFKDESDYVAPSIKVKRSFDKYKTSIKRELLISKDIIDKNYIA